MAIDSTYQSYLFNKFLRDKILEGDSFTGEEILDLFEEYLEDLDLTKPQFCSDDYRVERFENSSASKHNNTFELVKDDLSVLYLELLELSKYSIESYERWKLESNILTKRLHDIETRIEDLLFLTEDTEGYFYFMSDNFTDTTLVDKTYTTAEVDIKNQIVKLSDDSDSSSQTRIFLDSINQEKDISFRIRTTAGLIGRVDDQENSLKNIFSQKSNSWKTSVRMKTPAVLSAELTVKLADSPIPLSRIDISISNTTHSSPITITPLYSEDGYSYRNLPSISPTREIRATDSFLFPEIETVYIKFLLSKKGPDYKDSTGYVYEVGFREIAFFSNSFSISDTQDLVSTPLSVLDKNGEAIDFSKVSLEVDERLEANTSIDYFITVSDNPLVPVTNSGIWYPISPSNREEKLFPVVLDFKNKTEVLYGIDEPIAISYDPLVSGEFSDPKQVFHLLSLDTDGTILDEEITATEKRYTFTNLEDKILDYQLKITDYSGSGTGDSLDFNSEDLLLLRDIGEKGLEVTASGTLTRDSLRGWRWEDPYYVTVVEIQNPGGLTLDVGSKPIIIDNKVYTNKIDSSILTGRTASTDGIHEIKVYKDNWIEVTPSLNSLDELKAEDYLYPFNHRYLIEGYLYGNTYPSSSEQIYRGVDVFASYRMRNISLFDFVYNCPNDNYSYYALDKDAPDTHTSGNEPTQVFLVKTNPKIADFQNERFMLRFNLINQQYKYLRLKAVLSTESTDVSPALDNYRIKIG